MVYECQNCYARLEDTDVIKSSMGELQCPECGSFEIDPLGQSDSDGPGFDYLEFEGGRFQGSELDDTQGDASYGVGGTIGED